MNTLQVNTEADSQANITNRYFTCVDGDNDNNQSR